MEMVYLLRRDPTPLDSPPPPSLSTKARSGVFLRDMTASEYSDSSILFTGVHVEASTSARICCDGPARPVG